MHAAENAVVQSSNLRDPKNEWAPLSVVQHTQSGLQTYLLVVQ